mgnify:FL=1
MELSGFPVYGVTQVNQYIKGRLDSDELLSGLLIRGEISNYKRYPSGHHYFSLKDAQGSLRCVLFRGDALRLRFQPANGMEVVAFGRITVFPRDGQYQLYCTELFPSGLGALNEAYERLKEKLRLEGLFDESAKRPLPRYPKKIALVTSPAGAAVRDMLRILKARWPMAAVLLAPVRVQGEGAADEIAGAIHALNNRSDIDLIIAGRGGGSLEDLWAFNEEAVARAIYVSNIPVISAVGHEPDVTIADYAADLRAATPSNGAELAVPDCREVSGQLAALRRRMARAEAARLFGERSRLTRLTQSRVLRSMAAPIQDRRMLLEDTRRRMAAAMEGKTAALRGELARLCTALDAMSPLRVLARGYAIALDSRGRGIGSVSLVEPGADIAVRLSDGILNCTVTEKEAQADGRKKTEL